MTNDANRVREEIEVLEAKMLEVSFWEDKDKAQATIKEIKRLKDVLQGEENLEKGCATLSVLAGAGGDDSEDFARMLVEMYHRYVQRQGFSLTVLHEHKNDHGGYRSYTCEIKGSSVYGSLRYESGVHRLVRVSPFNAQAKRHTSFALVEVMPVLPPSKRVELDPKDLRIETSRAGGPGGQNVNKRETAVRVVHIPTNCAVHVTTERSQEQNREKALELLSSKLFLLEEEARKAEVEGRQISKTVDIEWGNQIRSYVLHPYKMVKDHRTDFETSDVEGFLERGEIEECIVAEQAFFKEKTNSQQDA